MNIADRNMEALYKYIDWKDVKYSRGRYVRASHRKKLEGDMEGFDLKQHIIERYPEMLIHDLKELKNKLI